MVSNSAFFKLNNGNLFPLIGFGTYCIQGLSVLTKVLDEALATGYRSFDTASMYENEEDIGRALKDLLPKYKLTRGDIYLTSKLLPQDQGKNADIAAKRSIEKLQCDYLDLFLIHWPGFEEWPGPNPADPRNAIHRKESWFALAKLHRQGLIRNIGVSNYTERHLSELIADCDGVLPAVNQLEWHPHHHPQSLLDKCRLHGIMLQAYSSLGGSVNRAVVNDPEIHEIANEMNKPVALVLLKWAVQQNIAIIPKAVSPNHIRANFNLDFEIPKDLMTRLSNLSTKIRYDWNPEDIA